GVDVGLSLEYVLHNFHGLGQVGLTILLRYDLDLRILGNYVHEALIAIPDRGNRRTVDDHDLTLAAQALYGILTALLTSTVVVGTDKHIPGASGINVETYYGDAGFLRQNDGWLCSIRVHGVEEKEVDT